MNKLSKILTTICAVLLIWSAISTLEVACKNLKPNPQYSALNLWEILFVKDEPKVEAKSTRYTAYGRYYTEGTIITDDGNEWLYYTDTISNEAPYDGMPIWIGFDDNATPNDITDDIPLGLVYDRETAIYDELETALGDTFELERDGNNIHIGGIK